MKRGGSSIRYMILLLCICSSYLVGAQEAIYVYRNDGQFHAFFNDEIDSIAYSYVDTLGNYHENIVVQEIYALDSIYRIPISAIDSVSLHAPVPVFQSDVKVLDSEYAHYVVSMEDSTIILSSNLPASLMPNIGDVLVTEHPNTSYPSHFSGRVANIQNTSEGWTCLCNSVELTDIYSRLVVVGKSESVQEDPSREIVRKSATQVDNGFFSRNNLHISVPVDLDGFNLHLDIDPKRIELRYAILVEDNKKTVTWVRASQSTTVTVSANVQWEREQKDKDSWIKKSDEINNILKKYKIPVEVPVFTGVTAFVELRPVLEFRADVFAGLSWSFSSTTTDDVYRDANNKITHKSIESTFNADTPKVQASIDGEICGGCGIKIGLGGIKRSITSIGADIKLMLVLSGNAHFEFSPIEIYDTYIYDAFKDSKVSLGVRAEIKPFATFLTFSTEDLFGDSKKEETKDPLTLSVEYNFWELYLFPDFTDFVSQANGTHLNLQIDASRLLIWPSARVGIGIFDDMDRLVGESFYDYNWGTTQLHLSDDFNLHQGYAYDCYPLVQVQWGNSYLGKIKASPMAHVVLGSALPAKISNFEQINATFIRDGFKFKDKTYYYDFAATTTVELESNEGVDDWGYVYKDVDGDTVHISVKDIGGTDSRYNYYRTIPKSTATLYGYAKYGNKYVYDEPKDYPLEYTFHPIAYVGNVITDSLASTSSQFEYGFDDVPRTGKCFTAVQSARDNEPIVKEVSYAEKDTVLFADLHPGATYEYWAYVEYAGVTYTSDKKSLTTQTPTAHIEQADEDKVTMTSAEIAYRFSNVPDDAKCYLSIEGEAVEVGSLGEEYIYYDSKTLPVSNTEKGSYKITELHPGTTYACYAYIEYDEDTWYSNIEMFTTKAPPTPIATTGDCSKVTTNSATVSCSFENVPEGGVCGVEYTWSNGSKKQSVGNANGTQTITVSGLESGTTYSYCAYVEAYGQTYYGEEKTFTTQVELPNLAGTWSCTVYKDDGSVLDTPTLTLTSDGKATIKNSSFTSEDKVGGWSINANGKASISFNWASSGYNPVYYQEAYSGTVNSMTNPSSIEGTVSRKWAGLSEHGTSYKFKMTR